MDTELHIKSHIKDLAQKIYDDLKLLDNHGIINLNTLSDEKKIDLDNEDCLIKKRIENNKNIISRLYGEY